MGGYIGRVEGLSGRVYCLVMERMLYLLSDTRGWMICVCLLVSSLVLGKDEHMGSISNNDLCFWQMESDSNGTKS